MQNGPNPYHTTHGEDALFIANDYYHTTDAITYLGTDGRRFQVSRTPFLDWLTDERNAGAEGPDGQGGLPSQAISHGLFVDIVRDLLINKRYRVEVWAVPTGGGRKDQNNWKIIKRASPGNVNDFEDLMFQEDAATGSDNPITIALQFGYRDGEVSSN